MASAGPGIISLRASLNEVIISSIYLIASNNGGFTMTMIRK
jgi:hypothetical protein